MKEYKDHPEINDALTLWRFAKKSHCCVWSAIGEFFFDSEYVLQHRNNGCITETCEAVSDELYEEFEKNAVELYEVIGGKQFVHHQARLDYWGDESKDPYAKEAKRKAEELISKFSNQ